MTRRTACARIACATHLKAWLVCLVLLAAVPVLAQSGGDYGLSWTTIDGGGVTLSAGGAYTLGGTAGQADAGRMTGGPYTLAGGFWPGGVAEPPFRIFVPLVMRDQ